MSTGTGLSIIIVNTNTKRLVCECLESIYRHPPASSFEILVVDNASTDGSCEAIEAQFTGVRLIRNGRNLGFSEGNNRALEVARGENLLLLNSDTVVLPGSLDKLLEAMAADRSVGIVAPKLIYPDGTLQMSYGPIPNLFVAFCTFFDVKRLFPPTARRAMRRSGLSALAGNSAAGYLGWYSGQAPETHFIDRRTYVTAACILIRRKCYEQVGGLDPGFFMYVDDADYSLRAHRSGWKIQYLAESTIVHIKGGTVGDRYRWTCAPAYQSMLYFLRKHHGGLAYRVGKGMAVVAISGRCIGSALKGRVERRNSWTLLTDLAQYEVSAASGD